LGQIKSWASLESVSFAKRSELRRIEEVDFSVSLELLESVKPFALLSSVVSGSVWHMAP
jgi:hypothetical protein